jgi:beta-N-acetylhexosaminidase
LSIFISSQVVLVLAQNDPDASVERAQALLDTMTPEERVGQLFLITFAGNTITPESPIFDLITNHHVGGVILQTENDNFSAAPNTVNQTLDLTRALQETEWSASQNLQIDPNSIRNFPRRLFPCLLGSPRKGTALLMIRYSTGRHHFRPKWLLALPGRRNWPSRLEM